MNTNDITTVELRGSHYYKREDKFVINGVCGGKARVINEIVTRRMAVGDTNFVTCGSRDSRQCEALAKICEHHGVYSHLFMPSGKDTDISLSIAAANDARIHRTKVGYNTVLISESRKYAQETGAYYIPFGMGMEETIEIQSNQVANVPKEVKRIVVPCGGGMNMIAIIKGLERYGRTDVEVVGVQVGANPDKTFNTWLQDSLFEKCPIDYVFVKAEGKYGDAAKVTTIDGIELDEMYEAKCIPFLQDGDLLWIVGKKM